MNNFNKRELNSAKNLTELKEKQRKMNEEQDKDNQTQDENTDFINSIQCKNIEDDIQSYPKKVRNITYDSIYNNNDDADQFKNNDNNKEDLLILINKLEQLEAKNDKLNNSFNNTQKLLNKSQDDINNQNEKIKKLEGQIKSKDDNDVKQCNSCSKYQECTDHIFNCEKGFNYYKEALHYPSIYYNEINPYVDSTKQIPISSSVKHYGYYPAQNDHLSHMQPYSYNNQNNLNIPQFNNNCAYHGYNYNMPHYNQPQSNIYNNQHRQFNPVMNNHPSRYPYYYKNFNQFNQPQNHPYYNCKHFTNRTDNTLNKKQEKIMLDKKIINNNKTSNNKSLSPEKIRNTKRRNLSPSQKKNKINYEKNLSSETKRRQEIRKNEINKSRANLANKLNKK